jgi:chromosome segregation ATPase
MAAVLNEALDEAVARAEALSGQLSEIETAARETAESVRALADRAREEGDGSHGLFADATTRLREAADHLGTAHDEAGGEAEGLSTRLSEVQQKVAALVAAIKAGACDLTASKATTASALDKRQDELGERAAVSLGKMQAFGTHVEERLGTVREVLSSLQQAVAETRQNLASVTSAVSEGLQELSQEAHAQARECVSAVSDAADQASTVLVQACGAVIDAHNRAMDLVRSKLQDDAPKLAETTFSGLTEAAQAIGLQCAKQNEALAAWYPQAQSWASQIGGLAERVHPPLVEAARLR